ncbi:MAG: type II toxin-antitoxin system mRNA interferase toxin, RelE/StbE family [Candidatus Brocadiaceae bacterium]|nr:type II toxin-antitoxin system mRNA interferase toxin, RelE/StbE family [Candidatus Brocadiaceae bacterium]
MIKITWDQSFKRQYKKKIKNNNELKKKFWKNMELFSQNFFNLRLRTHKLTGKLEGLWAFSIDNDCRIVFKFLEKDEILLIDLGSHDEVY